MFFFSLTCFLALASHGKAMLTDPGSVPTEAIPVVLTTVPKEEQKKLQDHKFRTCRRCRTFKPARAHHCSLCQRCVVKMDHHCPWVNNCVGVGNHKFFLLFIFYVFLLSGYALGLLFVRYTSCMKGRISCPTTGAMHSVLLLVEAVLFGLFTLCMMCDQYSVITTGNTQIDRLKGEESTDNMGIIEVFGGTTNRFSLDWILPVQIWFPASVKSKVLGYAMESELHGDETSTELDYFLPKEGDTTQTTTLETLEGGWSVEKHVPQTDVQIV